jgi:hypothetical protein
MMIVKTAPGEANAKRPVNCVLAWRTKIVRHPRNAIINSQFVLRRWFARNRAPRKAIAPEALLPGIATSI